MIPVFRTLEKVLESDTTVLIEGESGTGKDALAPPTAQQLAQTRRYQNSTSDPA
jgi:DNA-binding NtrC family response regulator